MTTAAPCTSNKLQGDRRQTFYDMNQNNKDRDNSHKANAYAPLSYSLSTPDHLSGPERTSSNMVTPTEAHPFPVGCKAECCVSILRRLAELEHSLAINQQLLAIDFVLIAERDTRILKDRLFACGKRSINSASNVTCDNACLLMRPCSILVLTILAQRVVHMLEDLFRRAAVSAQALERASRSAWPMDTQPSPTFMDLCSATESATSQRFATCFERSIRTTLDQQISCPVPDSNCELLLGSHRVSIEAESRAMKQILRRRFWKLAAMLRDLEAWVVHGSTTAQSDSDSRNEGVDSSAIFRATKAMVEELHRGVEALQGRIELAG
ncbi:hypothetical protein BBP40_004577 [Aspergillus hancockii]|nr:hypothetical protein BBP40_004577 [Aspergillus hancockii]